MGLYRDESGTVFDVDDVFARSQGYDAVSPEEEHQLLQNEATQASAEESGAAGGVRAGLTGVASSLTLGGSDFLLGHGLSDEERQALQSEIGAHPMARAGGEVAGALAGGLAAPGSGLAKTPAGYLGSLASREMEAGLVAGGVKGTAKALGAMGAEGALQSAGQYIGQAALADKDTTAEGLTGALGTGFAFGTLGGGAALGISKGTVAARRMFSRAMDGEKAAVAAETSWTAAHQELLDGDLQTANIAKKRLDDMRAAKSEAMKYAQEAKNTVREEQIRREGAAPEPKFTPDPVEPMYTEGGTKVVQRPPGLAETAGPAGETSVAQTSSARPSDEIGGVGTQVIPGKRTGAGEEIAPDFSVGDNGIKPRSKLPKYAEQDPGLAFQAGNDIRAGREAAAEPSGIAGMLDELDQYNKSPKSLDRSTSLEDLQVGPKKRAPFAELRTQLAKKLAPEAADENLLKALQKTQERIAAGETLADMRKAKTTELLGSELANDETRLTEALDEWQQAKADFDKLTPSDVTGVASPGKRKALEVLDRTHDESLLSVREGTTAADRGKALKDASDLEDMLGNLHGPTDFSSAKSEEWFKDLYAKLPVIERYEKASAKLADAVGESAHPSSVAHAKALADAETDAARKVTDRTTRAIEDAEQHGPWEQVGPKKLSGKERVVYAKERALEADKTLQSATADEGAAKAAYGEARGKVKAGEKAKKDALRVDAKAARAATAKQTQMGKAAGLGGMLEILDIPGLPKPSDLPFVGPLLGAYLKFRALKMAMGRAAGRIPATADARVAALASRTKDRIAHAVDRSLGLMAKNAQRATKVLPPVAGVLSQRIYDDGKPDVPKGAHITEVATRRMEEITSYVMTPGAIELDVRRELSGVTDPDIIAAAEAQRRKMFEYLLDNMPKVPDFGPLNKTQWRASPAQAMSFARRLEAVSDPAGVYERLEEQQAMLSLEAAEALRVVYPTLFDMSRQRVFEQAALLKASLPTRKRVQLSLLYKVPLDASMDPVNLKISQSVYERKPDLPPASMGAPMPAQPPVPSIAQPTNLMPMYQTGADRNSQR